MNLSSRQWQRIRLAILDRDQWTCRYCGNHAATVDHIRPRIEGGTDAPQNLVAACRSCNSRRSIQWHNNHPHRTMTSLEHNRWHTIRRKRGMKPTGALA